MSLSLKHWGLASIICLGLAASPVLAQEIDEEEEAAEKAKAGEITLSTIVVTASGFEQEVLDAPASISLVTREELEDRPFNNLADAVRDVPGVSYIGGGADEKDISIRGMPGE